MNYNYDPNYQQPEYFYDEQSGQYYYFDQSSQQYFYVDPQYMQQNTDTTTTTTTPSTTKPTTSSNNYTQGYNNQGYNNQSYNNQGYNNQGYNNQGYNNQGYNNQGYNNQGYNNQGYKNNKKTGYQNQNTNYNNYNNTNYTQPKTEEPVKEEEPVVEIDPFTAKLQKMKLKKKKEEVKKEEVKKEEVTKDVVQSTPTEESKDKENKVEKPKHDKVEQGVDMTTVRERRVKLIENAKGCEDFDYSRSPANIVFIGHVDSGKSTMCGCIMLLTGQIDERTIEKYEQDAKTANRESWWMAYILDLYEEERAKGKTVDVGKANFETDTKRFTILDAPGHSNYVPNMIQGAAQADIGCLVISAKQGEFESGFEKGGQTIEHAVLARSLGIRFLVCVVNKLDDPSINNAEARFKEIREKMLPVLKGQCGWNVDKDVSFVPVAALKKWNMDKAHKESPLNKWASPNLSLIEHLDSLKILDRDKDKSLRFNVLDRFKDVSNFVFGKIESGTVVKNQPCIIYPYGKHAIVEAIYDNRDVEKRYALPAENVKLKIKGIDDDDVRKGFTICDVVDPVLVSNFLEVNVKILELPKKDTGEEKIFSKGYKCILHIHTVQCEAEVEEIVYEVSKTKDKKKMKTKFIRKFCDGCIKIKLADPITCEKIEDNLSMGRFTLRDENKTIAIGKINKIKPWKAN